MHRIFDEAFPAKRDSSYRYRAPQAGQATIIGRDEAAGEA
jgi:hypothetical protein